MKLHRTTGQPDWTPVAHAKRNFWQRLAAQTNGLLTIGNVFTMIGLVLVIYGLGEIIGYHYYFGGILLAVGRLCDLVDGWLADITGTKSPLGELLDAVVDKIGTVATIVALFIATIAPWWVLAAILLPHILIALIIALKRSSGIHVHPSHIGKLSMAAAWVGILGLVFIAGWQIDWPHPIVALVDAIVALSVTAGFYTLIDYSRQQ